ncbi:MAG: OsmC family protein [Thermoplasmatota archaeon]
MGRHVLIADEEVGAGGDDDGIAPHEWILAGLGACTSMTIKMYAERKGWPLDSVQVIVAGDHVDGAFVMTRSVLVKGKLTDEQSARLLEVANKCPVHRSLTGPIRIETVLAAEETSAESGSRRDE